MYLSADWFRQLWAESLGKRLDREGREVFRGPTPVKALGATDQHSQVQLYMEGPFDKTVTLLAVDSVPLDVAIPAVYPQIESLGYLGGHTLGELLAAERSATTLALARHGRMNMTIRLPELNAYTLGQLLHDAADRDRLRRCLVRRESARSARRRAGQTAHLCAHGPARLRATRPRPERAAGGCLMSVVYLNGEWLASDAARVPIGDRGFLLGDGVFETARLHQGSFFRLEHHLARLASSAEFLRLQVPPLAELVQIALGLADRNHATEGGLRITVTRGSGGRGLGRRGAGPNTVLATLSSVPDDWEARAARGWTIRTAAVRRPATSSVPAQLKGLGRSYALLAHYEAEDAGFDDALLLSADGYVAEGPTWNVFWRVGSTLFTPAPESGILTGVTRGLVIDLARNLGLAVEEGLFGRDRLDGADEMFATMTSNGVVPIRRLDARELPSVECGSTPPECLLGASSARTGPRGIEPASGGVNS